MTINLRIPYWVRGGSVKINGTLLSAFASPSSYLSINRVWKNGDKIDLSLPMDLHIAPMPDNEHIQAMMYGPLVLAGRFEPVTNEMTYSGDYQPKPTDSSQGAGHCGRLCPSHRLGRTRRQAAANLSSRWTDATLDPGAVVQSDS